MDLRQVELTYSSSGTFTKNKEKTGDSRYIYRNELDKACCQHDIAYDDFNNSPRRIVSDSFLRNKAFNIAKNLKLDGAYVFRKKFSAKCAEKSAQEEE